MNFVAQIASKLPHVPPNVVPAPADQLRPFLSSIISFATVNACAEKNVSVMAVQKQQGKGVHAYSTELAHELSLWRAMLQPLIEALITLAQVKARKA